MEQGIFSFGIKEQLTEMLQNVSKTKSALALQQRFKFSEIQSSFVVDQLQSSIDFVRHHFTRCPLLFIVWNVFNDCLQISAKRGLALKFEAEANSKFLVPKSKQSSILISQNLVSTNAEY